jgi:RNA polymerase sigma-70 factor (ECF subfamily)
MGVNVNSVAAANTDPAVLTRKSEADADWVLVRRVQAGEVERFDDLVLKYRERIWSVIYHLTANREDAADLAQDAFIKAFRSINRFQGQSSFFTWLYRIAINGTLNHLNKNKNRRFFSLERIRDEEPVADLLPQLADAGPASDRQACLGELQEKLNEAMQKLSIKHRTVVTLFEIDGLSHEEIALITEASIGTVRSRLHYAKQLLQNELKDYLR